MKHATLLLIALALPSGAQADTDISGHYTVTTSLEGSSFYDVMDLKQDGDRLTGTLGGDPLQGTRHGDAIDFTTRNARNEDGDIIHMTVTGDRLAGTGHAYDETGHHAQYSTYVITGERASPRTASAPRHHEFAPMQFYRAFSPDKKPALTIAPGDTVHTTTIDAGGMDEKGIARSLGGNPQTGPFYIEGVLPGDTLAIHITKLRLNRDWATSDDALVSRAVNANLAVTMKDTGRQVFWHLDRDQGFANPEKPAPHLADYKVPLRPMLGCVAVAANEMPPPSSGDSGPYGGNMDFNEIVEGTTIYLQAQVPGALLYLGDGHAAMGDGELNGNALETSMEVEFRVDVISGKGTPSPRVESANAIMALGYAGSLDDALKTAMSNMSRWLTRDYNLNASEVSQVLGTAARIHVSEAADRNAGVAVMIDKSRLATLTR